MIGEYGDALLRGGQYEEEELVQEVQEHDLVDLFSTILNSSYATQTVSEYIVTALIKLTTRLNDPGQIDRIRRLLQTHSTSLDVEIQQRAVEYTNLFGYDSIRRGVLERMPPPEIREEQRVLGEAMAPKKKSGGAGGKKKHPAKVSEQDMLLDLMGGDDPILPGGSDGGVVNGGGQGQSQADLLADILGGGSNPAASAPAPAAPKSQSNTSAIMDLFDSTPTPSSSQPASQPPTQATPPQHQIYSKNNLQITLQLQRNNEGIVQVTARFKYTGGGGSSGGGGLLDLMGDDDDGGKGGKISGLNLQAAVPKSQRIQLNSINRTVLQAGGGEEEAMQMMRINGVGNVSSYILLRLYAVSPHPFSFKLPFRSLFESAFCPTTFSLLNLHFLPLYSRRCLYFSSSSPALLSMRSVGIPASRKLLMVLDRWGMISHGEKHVTWAITD